MHVWYSGMLGSGLPRATKGLLPFASATSECPCDFDVFTANEGPQIVATLDCPRAISVTGPNTFPVLRIVRQLKDYPRDLEDGRLIFWAENSPGAPFPTNTAVGEILHDSCDGTTALYGTMVVAPGDLSELAEEGPIRPLNLTIHWNDGAARTLVDNGLGVLTGPIGAGTVDYCTRVIVLDLTGTIPVVATDITADYTTMDPVDIPTLNTGTISGGRCLVDTMIATQIDCSAWTGYAGGIYWEAAAVNYNMAALPANTYYFSVNSLGVITRSTFVLVGDEILSKIVWDGLAITDGPYDERMMLNLVNSRTHETLDFYYYAVFVYSNVALDWHRCTNKDYALAYDTQRMVEWLWKHTPENWRSDDQKTNQVTMISSSLEDGQTINLHEDPAELHGELYRFLKWFALQGEQTRAYIRALMYLYIDVDLCPEEWLHSLAFVFNFNLPRWWDVNKKRYFIKQCTSAYRIKGTEMSIIRAAYRICGIPPTIGNMYEHVLYTNTYGCHTLDTTAVGDIGSSLDPHQYSYGPVRTSHYHEKGVNLYFPDPTHSLLQNYNAVLLRGVKVGSGPIYRTTSVVGRNKLNTILDEHDFIMPSSLTISWTDVGGFARSMTDDGSGHFTGSGDPTHSNIDYQTGNILLKTVMAGVNHQPRTDSNILCVFKSTSRGMFKRVQTEVKKFAGSTAHVAYYINGSLMALSE